MKQLLYGSTLRINRLFADYRRATHKKVVEFTTMGFKNSNQIVEELYHEGFIYGYQEYIENNQKFHRIFLKYTMKNKSLLTNVKYVSRPGNRIFVQLHHLKKWKEWNSIELGFLRTKYGFISTKTALKLKTGGELLVVIS